MGDSGPSYVDTLSSLFNTNRSNSRGPGGFDFPQAQVALNELAKVTVALSTVSQNLEDEQPVTSSPSYTTPSAHGASPDIFLPSSTHFPDVLRSTVATIVTQIANTSTFTPSTLATTTTLAPPNFNPESMVNADQRLGLTAFLFTIVVVGILVNSYTVHLILSAAQLQMRWHWWNITMFNLAMVDLISNVLHATTMLVHGDALMMWEQKAGSDSVREGGGVSQRSVSGTSAIRGTETSKEGEATFFCKFQFVANFTCFVVPAWIIVVGLLERLLAMGWRSQYNDILSYGKLHVLFICAWVISIVAAGYSAILDDWVIYNPTTGFCILNLQNPIGFPWFMLCFFYFVVLPIVLIIPLVIFTLSDEESRRNAELASRQQLPESGACPIAPTSQSHPQSHGVGWVHSQQQHQHPQLPRIQVSEIRQWHSRRSSCSEADDERSGEPAATGRGRNLGGALSKHWQQLWTRIKAVNLFKNSSRSPVEQIRSRGRPPKPPPRPPLQRQTATNAVDVDPYGGRLFSMTQERPNLRHETATELSLVNPQIMRSVLAVLATLVVLKVPTGLLAICKMFAMDKNTMSVPSGYAYGEIVTLCMYFVGCVINPFVYLVLRTDFREACMTCWANCVYAYW